MEIEDFEEDRLAPPRAPPGAGKPGGAFGSRGGSRAGSQSGGDSLRIPAAGNTAGRQNYGLEGELDSDAPKDAGPGSLAGGMQRLNLQEAPLRPAGGYGLAAETQGSLPASRTGSATLGRGPVAQPGGPGGSLRGPGASPLRPVGPGGPQQLQGPEAYGLAAETSAASNPSLAGGIQLPPPPPLPPRAPMMQPAAAPPYGMASEALQRPPMPQPSLRRPSGADYGLDAEAGAAAGLGAYGLGPEVAAAQAQPQMHAHMGEGYGLEADIAQQHMMDVAPHEMWAQPFDDTFSLEQLPEDQRWLHLNARQAERIITELYGQGTVPAVVDIVDVREKLVEASNPPRLAYLAAVEQATPDHRLPVNCRPSLLQTKLKAGQNRLRKLIEPVTEPGGQQFVDFNFSPDGALQPETGRVWQFGLSLVEANGVGKTGLQRVRQPCLFIARMAIFDRRANRFLGNVFGLRPEAVSNYDKRWEFNPDERVIVRCGCVQSDPQAGTRLVSDDALSIFVEFNLSYRLTVDDTINMPQSEQKCSQLLDEINTCWGMISFKKCASLQREVQISVPLYYGSIYDPKPMDTFYAEKRSKTPVRSIFKAKENPVLQFRVGPLNSGKPPLVPYAFMPTTMLATHDLGTAMASYRMNLALLLARQAGPFVPAADPVLAAFPLLLSDHHLLAEFLTRWRDLTHKMTALLDVGCCSPDVLPPLAALVEAFRRCVIELAPLAHCPTIPARHINNFIEFQGHRLRLVQRYCHVLDPNTNKILGARHPVEPLSHAGFEFLHAPFDASEVRLCMADRLERPVPFYRH